MNVRNSKHLHVACIQSSKSRASTVYMNPVQLVLKYEKQTN